MQLKQLEISDKKVRHHHLLQAVLQNLEQRAGRLVAGVPTNPSHATLKLPRVEVINREQIEGITGLENFGNNCWFNSSIKPYVIVSKVVIHNIKF